MKYLVVILVAILSIVACSKMSSVTEAQKTNNEARSSVERDDPLSRCVTMKFHYVVVSDDLYSSNSRRVEIFMDEKAFSVENLKSLFSYLSKKYADPENLVIAVNTNWSQLQLPSDCPGWATSGLSKTWNDTGFNRAVYTRIDKGAFFRYSTELNNPHFETVIMKGEGSEISK